MKKIIFSVISLALLATSLFGKKPETPKPEVSASLGAKYISVQDAKKAQKNGALMVDARKYSEYAEERIKGAVSAVYKEKGGNKNRIPHFNPKGEKLNMKNIPANKNMKIITYCNGPHCWRSFKAAVTLTKMGYKNVYWMRDGIPAWKAAGFPTE